MTDLGRAAGWIAYGRQEKRFETPPPAGRDPRWLADGSEMIYADKFMVKLVGRDGKPPRMVVDAPPNEIGRQISLSSNRRRMHDTVVVAGAAPWMGTAP